MRKLVAYCTVLSVLGWVNTAALAQSRPLTQWTWTAHGEEITPLTPDDPNVALKFACTVDHTAKAWPSIIGTLDPAVVVRDGDVLEFQIRLDADSDMPSADVPVKWQCPNMGLQINFRRLVDRFAEEKGQWMKVAVPLATIDELALSFYIAEKDFNNGAQLTVSVRDITLHRGSRPQVDVDVPELAELRRTYPQIRAFDFGKSDTLVRPGFDQVTPDSMYHERIGHGWRTGGTMTAMSYDTGMYSTNQDYWGDRHIPPKVYTNELTQDFVQGSEQTTFRIDLPDGRYRMYFLMGWAYMGGSQINDPPVHWTNLHINGELREQIKLDRASTFAHQVIDIEVSDGTLDIGFSTQDFAWLINAVVIYPQACESQVKPYLDEVNLEIDYLPKPLRDNWQEVPNLEVNPEPTPSADDRQRGFMTFVRDNLQEVYPTTRPAPDEIGKSMRTFTPPGEATPVTFSIYPLEDLQDVRIEPSALTATDGKSLAADVIDVRRVRCILSKVGDFNPAQNGHSRLIPEILESGRPFNIASHETTRLWLTINVPNDAEPGDYHGIVGIMRGGKRVGEIPLHVKVLPFQLHEDEQLVYSFMWGPPLLKLQHNRGSAYYTQLESFLSERTMAELQSMKAHGVNTLFLSGALHYAVENDALEIDFDILQRVVDLSREAGFDRPIIMILDGRAIAKGVTGKMYPKGPKSDIILPDRFYELYQQLLVEIERKRESMGWPELIYMLEDEANSPHYQRFCDRIYTKVREVLPDIKLVMTGREDTQRVLTDHLYARIYPAYSEWTMFDEATTAEECAQAGDQFWAYPNIITCGSGTQPAVARYLYGTWAWKIGLQGLMPFGYNDKHGNPINHFDSFYRGAGIIYPGWDDYPVPTTQYEGMREGIIDRRYFYTLQQLVDEAGQHANRDVRAAAQRVTQELDTMREAIPFQATFLRRYCFAPVWQYPETENIAWPNELMHDYRWWMACQIMHLSDLLAGEQSGVLSDAQSSASWTAEVVEATGMENADARQTVVAAFAGSPVDIDGRLDESAWSQAGVFDAFVKTGAVNQQAADPPTHVRALCDGQYLYIAAECEEPDPALLRKVSDQQHDGDRVWTDECIEMFFDPTRQQGTFYHIIINSDAVTFDAVYRNGERMDTSWDSGVKAACRKLDDRWMMEAAIPLDAMGQASDVWAINIGRERHTDVSMLSSWTGTWVQPSGYGRIVLARSNVYISGFKQPRTLFGENQAEITLVNHSGGSYTDGAQVIVRSGEDVRNEHVAFTVPAGREQSIAIPYVVDRAGPAEVEVVLVSDDGGAMSRYTSPIEVPQPIAVTMPSYAVRGESQQVSLRLNLADEPLRQAKLSVDLFAQDATLPLWDKSQVNAVGRQMMLHIVTAELVPGRYDLKLTMTTPAGTSHEAVASFNVLPAY